MRRWKTAVPLILVRAPALAIFVFGFMPIPALATDIVISPSHAASYFHILSVASGVQAILINIDQHHDLAALRKTDSLRRGLTTANDEPSRHAFLLSQKERGSVPCWSWIEPLMPNPIGRVHWIAPPGTELPTIRYLEAKLKKDRRELGANPVTASGISGLAAAIPEGPWILSIDLDYFDGSDDFRNELREILELCRDRPPLLATAAVSMPYLSSEESASRLVRSLVDAVIAHTDWRIIVDIEPERGPVDKEREGLLVSRGRAWREYDPVEDGLLAYAEAWGLTPVRLISGNHEIQRRDAGASLVPDIDNPFP